MSKIWLNFIYKKKINAAWNWLVCKPQTCYKMVSSVSFFCSEYSSMQYLIVNYFHSFCGVYYNSGMYECFHFRHLQFNVIISHVQLSFFKVTCVGFWFFFFFLQLVPKYNILLMHKIHWYSVNTIPVHVPSLFYLQCENFFFKTSPFLFEVQHIYKEIAHMISIQYFVVVNVRDHRIVLT